jgi:hypothetical protein
MMGQFPRLRPQARLQTVLALLLLGTLALPAQEAKAGVVKGRTAYLQHPVAGSARTLTVFCDSRRESAVTGWIALDPNSARLDPFGDPQARTRMAVRTKIFTAHRLRLADPKGRRALYRLEIDLPGEWHLVRPLRKGVAPRLLVREEKVMRVLTLEPAPDLPDRGPAVGGDAVPEPGSDEGPRLLGPSLRGARYEVVAEEGQLFLVARGQAPTPGYRIALLPRNRSRHCRHFELRAEPPTGMVVQVLTPYEVRVRIQRPVGAANVEVLDRGGVHLVPVPPAPR